LKRNKKIYLCCLLCLSIAALYGQDSTMSDSVIYESTIPAQQFDPDYHFDDSAQAEYNRSTAEPAFNRLYWEQLVRDMTFEEKKPETENQDSTSAQNKKNKTTQITAAKPFLKYTLIGIAILVLLWVLFKFLPVFNRKNIKHKESLIIGLDDLDEEDIKSLEIDSDLEMALKNGDYRKAYRLRYLSVLKQLVNRNLILYRKEKTNYEYMLQLTGHDVYEPFRLLTFNFDGIWYGDLSIDKNSYEALEQHFIHFNRAIGI